MRLAWLLVLPAGLAIGEASGFGDVFLQMAVPVSCAAILLLALCTKPERHRDTLWVVLALVLSAGGDWFLSSKGDDTGRFVIGIAFFFGAHVGYLIFAWRQGRPNGWVLGALLLAYCLYYILRISPAIADPILAGAVLLYLLISCLVFAAAWGMRLTAAVRWPYAAGMGLIVFSDTLISFSEFLGFSAWNNWILPTYFMAHLCVSWAVLKQMRHNGAASSPACHEERNAVAEP